MEEKFLREQQVHSVVLRVKTTVSLSISWFNFYFFTLFSFVYLLIIFFLVGKNLCVLHILLLILQDFKNNLPSQDFNIYRTCTEKFMSSDFIKLFILSQKVVGILNHTCLSRKCNSLQGFQTAILLLTCIVFMPVI